MMERKLAQSARNVKQSNIRAVTRKIEKIGGVNLGQGTCALPTDPRILQAAHQALDAGHNSYTLFDGIAKLRTALVKRYRSHNHLDIGVENVLVCSGATGAFESICKSYLEPGDEVVMFEPIYQYHVNQVRERAATPRFVRLHRPDWSFNLEDLEKAISPKTKFLIFSNPHNPTGKVFSRAELQAIGELCRDNNVLVVVDEVYEYILDRGEKHISLASLPGMFENTVTMSSASKTLFVTGWRVGWLIAPEDLMPPFGIKSDDTYICAPAPFQHAVADALSLGDEFFDNIKVPFQDKRNILLDALQEAGFQTYPPKGAYYILAEYDQTKHKSDEEAMTSLIDAVGVGAVPGCAFYPSTDRTGMLRFCFAVTLEDLTRACDLLKATGLRAA